MIRHAQTPEQREKMLAYLASKLGYSPSELAGEMSYHLMASVNNGQLGCVVMWTNYRKQSMEFHLAGGQTWVPRADIRELFAYPFVHVGCLRLWCLIARNNKIARKRTEWLGFRVLGVADDEFGEGKDGIIYSLRRADCRWLR